MTTDAIRFHNGATYERYMGKWSQLAGAVFLDWLAPQKNLQWLDVGCGNGAFTEMLVERCAPASIHALDPSEEQLDYARMRPALGNTVFSLGDAMAMPYADDSVDIAVMPLVIFFVPDPAKGIAEMTRVVRPGGSVAAYAWDMIGGGFPYERLLTALRQLGISFPAPPSPEASQRSVMQTLWAAAGLKDIQTREIVVHRSFADFDDFWSTAAGAPSVGQALASMAPAQQEVLKAQLREQLPADAAGKIRYSARANAVSGRVPD